MPIDVVPYVACMADLEPAFRLFASFVALGVELCAIITVVIGATEAMASSVRHILFDRSATMSRRAIWVRFAGWILLALEFTLASDIIRTAIAPTWDQLGRLAAIAAIRTVLNFFLGRDVKEASEMRQEEKPAALGVGR